MKKGSLVSAVILSVFLLSACGEIDGEDDTSNSDSDLFEVAVIPSQSIGEMAEGLSRLEEHLTEQLNMTTEVTHYPSYNAVVEAINYGHVDLAYFGPVTYLMANEQSGAEAIVTQIIGGDPYYYSYIITQPDAPWNTLEDLLANVGEVNFAFGSQSSTSGFTIPGYELYQRGVYESESTYEFESVRFTGSHDITANVVANGDVDAGAIDSSIFQALIDDEVINEEDYKIIWESEQIYQYPWAVPNGTDPEFIEQIQSAFLMIDDDEILTIFGGAEAFVEASHEEYDSILEAARAFDLLEPEPEESKN